MRRKNNINARRGKTYFISHTGFTIPKPTDAINKLNLWL
jgi:hypothetical protein